MQRRQKQMKGLKKLISFAAVCGVLGASVIPLSACAKSEEVLTLRVANWEEYIDLGDWGEDELIDIQNPYAENPDDGIIGRNSIVDDFTEWFNSQNFGYEIKVEYSTFGTNEDLYNRLKLGDVYDLVCPSDYLIMKLIAEGAVEPYSDDFLDAEDESNYYTRNVSPYIAGVFSDNGWTQYAACYMWGTVGIMYNPETIEDVEDINNFDILLDEDYYKQVTVKDNVRDAYFAALSILNKDTLLKGDITAEKRTALLNATDEETVAAAEDILKRIKENVYSFETDSGKADMITGKVAANTQWSGDSVYIMDEAESDETNPTELWYSVPEECTNLWFDGWVMLKDGIGGDERRKQAAEAFVNFLSRPDNAVRNMYYIGYTSAIASDTMFDYFDWYYGLSLDPEDEEYFDEEITEVFEYDVSYYFGGEKGDYTIYIDASTIDFDRQKYADYKTIERLGEEYGNDIEYTVYSGIDDISRGRQAFAQYPPESVIERSVVMQDFGDRLGAINQMWINVRCPDLLDFNPVVVWSTAGVIVVLGALIIVYKLRYRLPSLPRRKGKNNPV